MNEIFQYLSMQFCHLMSFLPNLKGKISFENNGPVTALNTYEDIMEKSTESSSQKSLPLGATS